MKELNVREAVPGDSGVGEGVNRRVALGLVLRSLAELAEKQGVTPHRVYRHIASKGETRLTPGRLQVAMQRAVKDGVLVQQRGRYNLNLELPSLDQAWGASGGCGCGSGSSKPRRRRSGSCKRRAAKRRSSRRRRRSSSSRRRCRRRRKPVCGQMSLYKRLMKILFPRKRCDKRRKRKQYSWVRQHCRRNPNHSRNKRRRR